MTNSQGVDLDPKIKKNKRKIKGIKDQVQVVHK
jgi:hypothetical protein